MNRSVLDNLNSDVKKEELNEQNGDSQDLRFCILLVQNLVANIEVGKKGD